MDFGLHAIKTNNLGSKKYPCELFLYIGLMYKWNIWARLLDHILELEIYGLETNLFQVTTKTLPHTKLRYCDGHPDHLETWWALFILLEALVLAPMFVAKLL